MRLAGVEVDEEQTVSEPELLGEVIVFFFFGNMALCACSLDVRNNVPYT